MAMIRRYYSDWYDMYSRYPYHALSAGGAYSGIPSSTTGSSFNLTIPFGFYYQSPFWCGVSEKNCVIFCSY